MLSVNRYQMSKPRLLHLLEELKANSIEVGSLCVQPGSSRASVESLLKTIMDPKSAPEDLSSSIVESKTGAILFWGPHHRYLVIPPFPVTREHVSKTCEIEPLHSLLHQEFLLGLVLVRLGEYGIGVFKGDKLLTAKVGTGYVHGRHRQGGSSAHRFERHRDKQMEMFFTRVCQHAREQLEPYERQIVHLLYGGTKETVLEFRKQCHYMHQFDKVSLDRLLNVRDTKQASMTEGFQEAWSSKVIQWD